MSARRRMYAIWICFIARLLFYAAMLPLWEGYDEWSHFSVIRLMAARGAWLVPRDAPIPRDVAASLDLAPVPWELRALHAPAVTEDAFWKLSPADRQQRIRAFQALPRAWRNADGPPSLTAYEALQPPLYYWLMAPVLRAAAGLGLGAQVVAVRWASVLLASLAIPLLYLVALAVFNDPDVALACAAVAALMPEWALDLARAGNDCLSVVLFTLLIWFGLKLIEEGPQLRRSAALGASLGLGLLTKAWFLTAVPAVALLYLWFWMAPKPRRSRALFINTGVCAGIAALISAWWYIRNLAATGTLSGLSESLMLRHAGMGEMASAAVRVPWPAAIDSILLSHLYFGGWSSLTVRAWMYHLFYLLILAAIVGVIRLCRRPPVAWLLVVYAAFWLGQLYNVVLISMSKGIATSMGWYLYAVIAAEVPLCVAGLRAVLSKRAGNWPLAGGVFLFGLLDIYTLDAVAIPYYSGLIAHKASGALASVHWSDLRAAGLISLLRRLAIFKGGAVTWQVLLALWIAWLAATIWLILEGSNAAAPGRRRDILR